MIPDSQVIARELDHPPPGYRGLGQCLHESIRAYLFEYFGHEIWIPKKVLVKAEGSCWAPGWAIESGKNYKAGNEVNYDK
jgi:hypothetical protein